MFYLVFVFIQKFVHTMFWLVAALRLSIQSKKYTVKIAFGIIMSLYSYKKTHLNCLQNRRGKKSTHYFESITWIFRIFTKNCLLRMLNLQLRNKCSQQKWFVFMNFSANTEFSHIFTHRILRHIIKVNFINMTETV